MLTVEFVVRLMGALTTVKVKSGQLTVPILHLGVTWGQCYATFYGRSL